MAINIKTCDSIHRLYGVHTHTLFHGATSLPAFANREIFRKGILIFPPDNIY